MENNVSRITNLIDDLIARLLPKNTPKNVIQNYQSYCLRILTSRINAKPFDDTTAHTYLQRSLLKRAEELNINKEATNQMSLRMQQLFQSLNKRKHLQKKSSICYLLCKISENAEIKQMSSFSAMDALMQTKQLDRSRIGNDNVVKQSGMEVETPRQGQVKGTLPTKTEPKANIEKLISQVANKGNPVIDISENDLLRELLYAFQGIDGNYIYYSAEENSFVIKAKISLSEPVKKMLSHLFETGWLYKQVANFIEKSSPESKGLIHKSLCNAIKEELNEYYRLIAMLENLRDADDEQSRSSYLVENKPANKSLSLRKLHLWTMEPFERLKWMGIFCEACKTAKGSVILSTIYSYGNQGSPSTQILVNRILKQALSPFSEFIKSWMYHGELLDQYGEFFISMVPNIKDDNLWHAKYILNQNMIPIFIDVQLAEKILIAGKSINFMKKCCGVNDWTLQIDFNDPSSINLSNTNQTLNFAEFKAWAVKAYELTNKALLTIMLDKYRLIRHFETIRKFLLFRQGDFTQYLMDLLAPELSKPANTIYKHNLVSILETAIRASNAQYTDNDLLSRVDIKLLDPSPGDNGWDIFSLTYKVEAPLTAILNPKAMTGYLRLFNFLWRIKRIEHSLNSIWLHHMKGASLMRRMKEFKVHIHKCNLLRNEMFHFIENLLNYLTIEVVESSWKIFMDELLNAQSIDEVISSHDKFVNSMLEKALLTTRSDKIYKQMIKIFDLIFRFKSTQEILITSVQEEDQKKAVEKNKSQIMELLGDNPDISMSRADNRSFEFDNISRYSARSAMRTETLNSLKNIWKDYKSSFMELLDLLKEDSLGGKLRFISFRLDFNEYYCSIHPTTSAIKEKKLEEFKFERDPVYETTFKLNPNLILNKPKQMISPPKFDQDDRMLTEDIGEEHQNKVLPPDLLSSMRNSYAPEQPQKQNLLRTIDFDVPPKFSSENASNINNKLNYLSSLIQSRLNPHTKTGSLSSLDEGNKSGIVDKKPILKSLNFGDQPGDSKQ